MIFSKQVKAGTDQLETVSGLLRYYSLSGFLCSWGEQENIIYLVYKFQKLIFCSFLRS